MHWKLKATLFGVLCGAFLFDATVPGLTAPISIAVPRLNDGTLSGFQQIRAVHPASGRHCLAWRRTWNSRHGIAHRRCVHWR